MLNKLHGADWNFDGIHSADLSADSSVTPYPINWKPDYWLVIARLSVGTLKIYPQDGRGPKFFKIDQGTITIPLPTDTLTVETVGATGWYSLYPVRNLKFFDIEA